MNLVTVHNIFKSCVIPEYVSEYYHYGYDDMSKTDSDLANFIQAKVSSKLSTKAVDHKKFKLSSFYSDISEGVYRMSYIYWVSLPSYEDVSKGLVMAVLTDKSRLDHKKSMVKFGRLLVKMFPWLEPKEIESIVDDYKSAFGPRNFTLHKSFSIAEVCTTKVASAKNFGTTLFKKSLHNSCMRHKFNQSVHPMKAYENGEFEVIYLLTENNRLAARTVVRISNKTYAPIYCVCDQSYNELKGYLHKEGYTSLEKDPRGWVGARLSLIPVTVYGDEDEDEGYEETEGYAIPYVDCIPCAYNTVEDDSIVIRDREDFDGEEYNDREPREGNYVYLKTADGYYSG